MTAFTTSLPNGIVGSVSRSINTAVIDTEQASATVAEQPTAYGLPVLLNTYGKVRIYASGDTDATIGFVARVFPEDSITNSFGSSTPDATRPLSILRKGYMPVLVNVGTPKNGDPVYVRITSNGGNTIIGGIEATADGAHTVLITKAMFTGAKDASGVAEITFGI